MARGMASRPLLWVRSNYTTQALRYSLTPANPQLNSLTCPALQRSAFKTKLCKLEDAPLILPLTLTSNTATYLAYRCFGMCGCVLETVLQVCVTLTCDLLCVCVCQTLSVSFYHISF